VAVIPPDENVQETVSLFARKRLAGHARDINTGTVPRHAAAVAHRPHPNDRTSGIQLADSRSSYGINTSSVAGDSYRAFERLGSPQVAHKGNGLASSSVLAQDKPKNKQPRTHPGHLWAPYPRRITL